jgi:hypothetical protein
LAKPKLPYNSLLKLTALQLFEAAQKSTNEARFARYGCSVIRVARIRARSSRRLVYNKRKSRILKIAIKRSHISLGRLAHARQSANS